MIIRVEIRDYTNKDGLKQVRIMISDKGKRSVIGTKIFVEPKDWDEKKQRVKASAANATIINQAINLKLSDVQKQVATDGVAEMIRKKETRLEDFIKEMDQRLSERNKLETVGNFRSQAKKLNKFAPGALIQEVNSGFLERYESHCRIKLGNKDGGVEGSMQFVTQVINRAILKGIVPANQIADYQQKSYKAGNKTHITRDEMDRWQKALDSGNLTDRQILVGYYYLLSCFTGLRHRDCMRLNKGMKVNGRLMLYTSKTDTPVSIKMNPLIEGLFDKCLSLGPLPETDMCNPYLDGIAKIAGIDKHLSYHTSRHSFAIECANLGVPIEICSRLMGHSSVAITQIYYKLANPTLDKAMDLWT